MLDSEDSVKPPPGRKTKPLGNETMPSDRDILAELRTLYREKRELDRAIQSLETYQRLTAQGQPRWLNSDDEQAA